MIPFNIASFSDDDSVPIVGDYILDNIDADFAFSFRKLRTGETKSVRLIRTNDNVETDVLLDSSNTITLLSTVSTGGVLGDWVGINDANIRTWYDQSLNGFDITTISGTEAYSLIVGGVINTVPGTSIPAVHMIEALDSDRILKYIGTLPMFDNEWLSIYWAGWLDAFTASPGLITLSGSSDTRYGYGNNSLRLGYGNRVIDSSNILNEFVLIVLDAENDIPTGQKNSEVINSTTASPALTGITSLELGGSNINTDEGYYPEIIGFAGKTANREILKADINTFYQIYI